MSIDKQVRDLSRLERHLRSIKVRVSQRKDKTIKVKWGARFDMFTVPSKEWGNIFVDEFEAVINRKADMVADVIKHIRGRVEQLSLELFGKEEPNGNKRCFSSGGEQLQSSADVDRVSTERAEDDSTGIDSRTGEQHDAGGPETGD